MATNYVYEGATLDYTNGGTALSAGDVCVIGEQIGIALVDIANGATGTVALEGVFTVPKVSGAVITVGQTVIWDASAGAFDDNLATPATGDVSRCCVAMESAGNGVTEIDVKINVGVGTVA
jgi:predicted RecA/RadA family phage recombinase